MFALSVKRNIKKWFANMNWNQLTESSQIDAILEASKQKPQAIFKHSTRCSISSMAKRRLESEWDLSSDEVEVHFLDLISYRDVSNAIAHKTGVMHQSPQLILLRNGEVLAHSSHEGIDAYSVKQAIQQ